MMKCTAIGGALLVAALGGYTSVAGAQMAAQLDPNAVTLAHADVVSSTGADILSGIDVGTFLGVDRFYNAGITGQNTISSNIEAGLIWGGATGHESLTAVTNYTTGTDALGETDRHATWVGMLIGGRAPASLGSVVYPQGIAYGTDLRSGAIATGWSGHAYSTAFSISDASLVSAYESSTAGFGTADVINSSWGFSDPGGSALRTIALDGMARLNPQTTFVVAAGNAGSSSNTVGAPGSGYNAITVGALANADGAKADAYDRVATFSSRGPQDYWDPSNGTITGVRAPVDITAPGDVLTSAYYGGQSGGNSAGLPGPVNGPAGTPGTYQGNLAGTSFATPIVTGGVSLLDSLSKNTLSTENNADSRDARVIKAVLLNSADKTVGWDNGQHDVAGVITTSQSLDYAAGAGRMNLDKAFDQYISGTSDVPGTAGGAIAAEGWDFGALEASGTHNDYVITSPAPAGTILTATLSWFRDRSIDGFTVLDTAFRNLDLEIYSADFTTLIAQSDSLYNDVEHLYLTLPAGGDYGIRVSYTGNVFGADGLEDYGLAWSLTAPVPEPSAAILLLLGIIAALPHRRRRSAGGLCNPR